MCEQYNGWTNRETWATALYINNERGLYESIYEQANELISSHTPEDETPIKECKCIAEMIEEFFYELFDMPSAFDSENAGILSMMTDIGSLYRVNWREIAETILQDIQNSKEPFLLAEAGN